MSTVGSIFEGSRGAIAIDEANRRNYRRLISTLALIAADGIAFGLATSAFRMHREVPRLLLLSGPAEVGRSIDLFAMLALVFIFVRYVCGDYTRRALFWDRAQATTLTLAALSSPCFLVVSLFPQYSVSAEILSWGFLLFAVPVLRQSSRHLLDYLGVWRIPTAFITNTPHYQDVLTTISTTLTLGCRISWLALQNEAQSKAEVQGEYNLVRFDSPREFAMRLYAEGCDQAVIAVDDMRSGDFSELTQSLMELSIAVSFVPSFRRLPLVGASTSYFFGKDILLFQMRGKLQSFPSRFVKRAFDVITSALALVFLSPVFLLVAFAIRRNELGPIFYGQLRVGRYGKEFRCWKFRSMAVDADARLERWRIENPDMYAEYQRTFKLVNDPRITPIGSWLRKTSLDELPQLWNVLIGEMSLVGPRPVVDAELVEFYGPAANLYKRVRPGITGIWQVRGRSNTTYEQRVIFDEWYVLNWSFWYDIVILFETVWVVLLRRGAY